MTEELCLKEFKGIPSLSAVKCQEHKGHTCLHRVILHNNFLTYDPKPGNNLHMKNTIYHVLIEWAETD